MDVTCLWMLCCNRVRTDCMLSNLTSPPSDVSTFNIWFYVDFAEVFDWGSRFSSSISHSWKPPGGTKRASFKICPWSHFFKLIVTALPWEWLEHLPMPMDMQKIAATPREEITDGASLRSQRRKSIYKISQRVSLIDAKKATEGKLAGALFRAQTFSSSLTNSLQFSHKLSLFLSQTLYISLTNSL